jgi:hypothetical protein
MLACSCSNPACAVNGCAIANAQRQQYAAPDPLRQGQCVPVPNLTPDDIRRIVREEIERASKAAK